MTIDTKLRSNRVDWVNPTITMLGYAVAPPNLLYMKATWYDY